MAVAAVTNILDHRREDILSTKRFLELYPHTSIVKYFGLEHEPVQTLICALTFLGSSVYIPRLTDLDPKRPFRLM